MFAPPSSLSFPRLWLRSRWRICICLMCSDINMAPASCPETSCKLLVHRGWKWAVTSPLFLSHCSPHWPRLFPHLTLPFVSLLVMQGDNSYSPTRSWLQRITGQNSFTAQVHHSERDSSSRLIYVTGAAKSMQTPICDHWTCYSKRRRKILKADCSYLYISDVFMKFKHTVL